MKRLSGAVVLVLWSMTAPAADIPLDSHGGALIVSATVNNRLSGSFLLDTGATFCVLSKDAARKAKIRGRVSGDRVELMTASGPLEAVLGEARKVEVGREVARDVTFAVVDGDPVPGLEGIIGLSFLENFRYTVDSAGGVLRLDR